MGHTRSELRRDVPGLEVGAHPDETQRMPEDPGLQRGVGADLDHRRRLAPG